MVLIRENLEKATIWEPVKLVCRVTDVPYDLAWPAIEHHGTAVHNDPYELAIQGVRINDLSPLWPVGHFRTLLLANAKRFVRDMAHQRCEYQLKTHEGDILIYGPYQAKAVHGNMIIRGRQSDECYVPGMYDFQIHAWFVAKYGRIPEIGPDRGTRIEKEKQDMFDSIRQFLDKGKVIRGS